MNSFRTTAFRTALAVLLATSVFQTAHAADPVARAAAPASAAPTTAPFRTADPEVVKSVIFLLKNSIQVTSDGRHNLWIMALRQLKDPRLEPLFAELADSDQRSLKVHGLLGLAECRPDKKFDMVKLAEIENAQIQEDAVGGAMANKLLTDEQAEQLLAWPKMGVGTKMAIAVDLVSRGKLTKKDVLVELAAAQKNLLQKAMANLLLVQVGDEQGAKELDELMKSTDPNRDIVRDSLMRIAIRYKLDKIAPWAMKMASEPGLNSRYSRVGLQAAVRFNAPGALELWTSQYNAGNDAAVRTRLALMALQFLPDTDARYFDPLVATADDPVIKQIGLIGKAVTSKTGIAPAVIVMINMNHYIADSWALVYCEKESTLEDSNAIMSSLITAYPTAPDAFKSDAFDFVVSATQIIADRNPDAGAAILKPILQDAQGNLGVQQAVLVGLIGSKNPLVYKIVEGLPQTQSPRVNSLMAILLAKWKRPLNDDQFRDMGVFAQGGAANSNALRLIAGWNYLVLTGQADEALAQVVGK